MHKTAAPPEKILADGMRPIKLLQPLRACVGECKLDGNSGLICAGQMKNHDTALDNIIRANGECRYSQDLTKCRKRQCEERGDNDDGSHKMPNEKS